jgi:putative DNA primase/helicase
MTGAPEAQFIDAAAERGLIIRNLIADGEIHRVDVQGGRRGKGDGAYLLHLDGIPAGGFQNHRDGLGWTRWRTDLYQALSPEKRRKYQEQQARKRQRSLAKREAAYASARARAREILYAADPAERAHPYLSRKEVQPHSTSVSARGDLIVPVRDVTGILHGLQFIPPAEGAKKLYMRGTRKTGCMFRVGWTEAAVAVMIIVIAEGFATGASIYESTGIPVALAFDEENLMRVALALREEYPEARLLLAADDDWKRVNPQTGEPENIGVISASKAAEAVQGIVAVPDFSFLGEDRNRETDFNDLQCCFARSLGRAEVKRQITAALNG